MDPQQSNYFSNLETDVASFLTAFARMSDRFQEAFDRGIDGDLQSIIFEGDLDHMTSENVGAAFTAYLAVNAVMDADQRAAWTAFLDVVRSWTR